MCTGIRLLLLICPFIFVFSFSPILNIEIFHHFSWELWGLEDWKLVHTWTVGRCIMNQAAAAYWSLYFFIFLSLQLKFFVTLFLGAVRPRRLKLGTHVDSGQMYRVLRNQAAAAYSSLYFFIFLSLHFSNIEIFRHTFLVELWGLEDWNFVHAWTVGRCIMYTRIRLLLIHPFISSFFFLSNFQTLKFFVTFLGNCEA